MAFSGALTLTDLNDYLGPSQACIKPVEGKDAPQPESAVEGAGASTEIAIDESGDYYESSSRPAAATASTSAGDKQPRARTKLETAEISLNDCLACSGCVTSAESVLIGMQSTDELRRVVQEKRSEGKALRLVASISPQTLASISARYSLGRESFIPLDRLLRRIERYLTTRLDFDVVMDTTFARHLSLQEHVAEFQERTMAMKKEEGSEPLLPMLASACPGWICYAEKTHGELLPLISKTRSPQQMAGLLAKRYLYEDQSTSLYHVTVMPCYDKKLEASRQDFFDDVTSTRDVDCVITTGELDGMMRDDGFDVTAPIDGEDRVAGQEDAIMTPPPSDSSCDTGSIESRAIPSMLQHPGSSSGSYLFELMRQLWISHLSSVPSSSTSTLPNLSVRTIRSADYTEYILRAPPGPDAAVGGILFKGAQCYGFRNLQNLVRKVQKQTGLKSKKAAAASRIDASFADDAGRQSPAAGGRGARGRGMRMNAAGRGGMVRRGGAMNGQRAQEIVKKPSPEEEEEARPYDYIEVMACPGGCVNGGGQLRPPSGANEIEGQDQMQSNNSLTARTITTEVTETIVESATPPTQLDPEGYQNGWASNGRGAGQEDDEGMDVDDVEEHKVQSQGWQGTSKDWVKRVERAYWGDAAVGGASGAASPHGIQAIEGGGDVSKRIVGALTTNAEARKGLDTEAAADTLAHAVRKHLCGESNEQRHKLLRTEYRGVQDEAVSGLAVQW